MPSQSQTGSNELNEVASKQAGEVPDTSDKQSRGQSVWEIFLEVLATSDDQRAF